MVTGKEELVEMSKYILIETEYSGKVCFDPSDFVLSSCYNDLLKKMEYLIICKYGTEYMFYVSESMFNDLAECYIAGDFSRFYKK